MSKLLETVQKYPQTEIWNDSCSCQELSESIKENGASGATTNPVIVGNVLKKELPEWEDTIRREIADHPENTEDDTAWAVIKAMGLKASRLLMPQFEASHGQKGRISFQTNAKYYTSSQKMIDHALDLAAVCPNAQIKLPASKAGIDAYEELTYQGVSINATVSFTVSQAIAVAEAVERGLRRREKEGLDCSQMHPVCTIMAGRVDDYLKAWLKPRDVLISANAIEHAGVYVVKNAYHIYQEKGYRTKLLVAAFRNLDHWREFIGGNIILTIPFAWQKKYNSADVEVTAHMNDAMDKDLLQELNRLDEFHKAFDPDGLKPEEFEHYGAFIKTMDQFLNGYDELVRLMRGYMVK
ncbi:MAG: transaldolase family protein [Solobacterium sp.]|jgi:transaldolase|nr:transaldolase family protein [Solobacterium sp.]